MNKEETQWVIKNLMSDAFQVFMREAPQHAKAEQALDIQALKVVVSKKF